MAKPRCTVTVYDQNLPRGKAPYYVAALVHNGHVLNAINYGSRRPSSALRRRVSAVLMRGCAELVRDLRRSQRRR